jgi:TolB protein
LNRFGTRAA